MRARLISSDQCTRWNKFAAMQEAFALQQGWEWGDFKERLGWRTFRIAVEENDEIIAAAQMLVKYLPANILSLAYIPRGPLVDWSNVEVVQCLFEEIHRVARLERAVFLKIEPPVRKTDEIEELLKEMSFRSSPKTNQPRNSIIIDIEPEPDTMLLQMRQKTRQYIRRSEREGISIQVGNRADLPAFIELMQKTSQREHFPARSREYYEQEFVTLNQGDQYDLLLAYQDGRLLAARTVCYFGAHAAEFHAGSIDGLDNLHPNYLLVWEAIKRAKSKGCKTYDLWGIPDEIVGDEDLDQTSYLMRSDGLWGVYRFKSGFSRNVVSYIGAYDYAYLPLLYAITSSPLISTEKFERIAVWVDSLRKAKGANGG